MSTAVKQLDTASAAAKQLDKLKKLDDIGGAVKQLDMVDNMKQLDNFDIKQFDNLDDVKQLDGLDDVKQLDGLDDVKQLDGVDDVKQLDGVDNVKNADQAKKAEDAKKLNKLSFCKDNLTACTAPFLLGGLYYMDQKFEDIDAATRACTAVCLPENIDELESSGIGGILPDSEVKYTTIESIQKGGPNGEGAKPKFSAADVPGKQPLCTADMDLASCTDYCYNKCSEINAYDGPGAGIVKGAKKVVKGTIGAALDIVGDTVDSIFGDAKWYVLGFVVLLIVLFVMKMMMGGGRRV